MRPGTCRPVASALILIFMTASACTPRAGSDDASEGRASGASPIVPATFSTYDAGRAPGGPGAGTRYALGARASDTEIGTWNTDIGQDGVELPSGAGSAPQGAAIYAAQCAACHGVGGVGGIAPNPALVGRDSAAEGFGFANDPKLVKTIGNYWPYATTLFDYIKRAMPLASPGSLSDRDVYALTAYLLSANRIVPADATLDAAALRAVRMPYANRFVPDDRRGGAEVR